MWLRESTAICYYPTRRRIDGVGSQQPLGQPRRPPSETKKARASFALTRTAVSGAVLSHGPVCGRPRVLPEASKMTDEHSLIGATGSARRSTKAGARRLLRSTRGASTAAAARRPATEAATQRHPTKKRRRSTTRNTRYRQSALPFRTTVYNFQPRFCNRPPLVFYRTHKYQ